MERDVMFSVCFHQMYYNKMNCRRFPPPPKSTVTKLDGLQCFLHVLQNTPRHCVFNGVSEESQ